MVDNLTDNSNSKSSVIFQVSINGSLGSRNSPTNSGEEAKRINNTFPEKHEFSVTFSILEFFQA